MSYEAFQKLFGLIPLSSISNNAPSSLNLFYNVSQPYKYAIFDKFLKMNLIF